MRLTVSLPGSKLSDGKVLDYSLDDSLGYYGEVARWSDNCHGGMTRLTPVIAGSQAQACNLESLTGAGTCSVRPGRNGQGCITWLTITNTQSSHGGAAVSKHRVGNRQNFTSK